MQKLFQKFCNLWETLQVKMFALNFVVSTCLPQRLISVSLCLLYMVCITSCILNVGIYRFAAPFHNIVHTVYGGH
jgi:hypothetical protein